MEVDRPVVRLRHVQEPPDEEVADRLRVRARLAPTVVPPTGVRIGRIARRRIADVEPGPVRDDRLVGHAVGIRGRLGGLGLDPDHEVVERALPVLEDPRLEPRHPMHPRPDRSRELLGGDRRLRVPLVREHRDDAGRLQQPARVPHRVLLERGVPGHDHRLPGGVAAEVLGQPPVQRDPEDGRSGEPVGHRPQLLLHLRGREEGLAEEHQPRVEARRVLREEVLEPVRVGVRVDDLGAREVDGRHQYRHRWARTISTGSMVS
jgi:hypothetical protein